jgi:hypothetical protein
MVGISLVEGRARCVWWSMISALARNFAALHEQGSFRRRFTAGLDKRLSQSDKRAAERH